MSAPVGFVLSTTSYRQEKREALNGFAYTYHEFKQHYGAKYADERWSQATKIPISDTTASDYQQTGEAVDCKTVAGMCNANLQEKREALNGLAYTYQEFQKHYGGKYADERWSQATKIPTSNITAVDYQVTGERVDCKTVAGTISENTCVRVGCGICFPPASYHDTALMLSCPTQQRHGGGLEDFRGVERLVDWADLVDTRLLHFLWLEGFCAPNDCIFFAYEQPWSVWMHTWLPDVVGLNAAQIYRFVSVCKSISLSNGFDIFEELANGAMQFQSKLRKLLSITRTFLIVCSGSSQDFINRKHESPIPYFELEEHVAGAARRLEQRGAWRFDCKQALEVYLFMSRMGRLAKYHNFFNKGLHGCGVEMYVAPWGRGCELLIDAFYASRDIVCAHVHLHSVLGDRVYFKALVEQLWQEVPELYTEFPLSEEERLANLLLSFKRAVKDVHENAFDSRSKKNHPEGRERKVPSDPRVVHTAVARSAGRAVFLEDLGRNDCRYIKFLIHNDRLRADCTCELCSLHLSLCCG